MDSSTTIFFNAILTTDNEIKLPLAHVLDYKICTDPLLQKTGYCFPVIICW